MIASTSDTLVLRPSRPSVSGAAPAPIDRAPIEIVKIGEQKIGQFRIGEGTYDDWADPAATDSL